MDLRLLGRRLRDIERAESIVLETATRLSCIFDHRDPKSEVARWCALPPGEPFLPSNELAAVLALALDVYRHSEGIYQPALAGVARVWRDAARCGKAPSKDEIDSLRRLLTHSPWEARENGEVIRGPLPVSLDSVAKGWIVDRMTEAAMAVDGIRGAMVNVGGDLCVTGREKLGVWVQLPGRDADNSLPGEMVRVLGGVATSGNQRRALDAGGKSVGHVLDPRTAGPAGFVGIASVWAPSTAEADVWSTACLVAGPEKSLEWFSSRADAGCCLLGEGGARWASAGWERLERTVK